MAIKRVLIVDNQVPFVEGGAEYHIRNLRNHLQSEGCEVDIVRLPFKWYPPENLLKHILITRMFDLTEANGEKIDMVITFRFPSYYIKHPRKVVWIMSTYKSAYEFWDTEYCDIPKTSEGISIRNTIHSCDKEYISESKALFSNSSHVSKWFEEYTKLKSSPLYHPPPDTEKLYCKEYNDFIFFPSRLTPYKRHVLALQAMKYLRSNLKLIITGKADNQEYEHRILSLIQELELDNRVIFLGKVSREEVLDLYARCLGVLFPTYKEDYGYITLEAMLSKKPVITCVDSGGPTEFVVDGVTGFVCEPDPSTLAEAMDKLYSNKLTARRMGEEGYKRVLEMDISWERVVQSILSCV
jgi:glycosyltransferase involved in cell wall biosynthesis